MKREGYELDSDPFYFRLRHGGVRLPKHQKAGWSRPHLLMMGPLSVLAKNSSDRGRRLAFGCLKKLLDQLGLSLRDLRQSTRRENTNDPVLIVQAHTELSHETRGSIWKAGTETAKSVSKMPADTGRVIQQAFLDPLQNPEQPFRMRLRKTSQRGGGPTAHRAILVFEQADQLFEAARVVHHRSHGFRSAQFRERDCGLFSIAVDAMMSSGFHLGSLFSLGCKKEVAPHHLSWLLLIWC